MPTVGNVPTAKIANCHTHPVAIPHKNFWQLLTVECVFASRSGQNDSGSR